MKEYKTIPEYSEKRFCCVTTTNKGLSCYLQIKGESVCDACSSNIDSMFEYPSKEDEASTRIRPSDMINMLTLTKFSNFSITEWNGMLAQIPLYVFPNFYVIFGLLLLDSPVSNLISHFAKEIDIFNLYPREIMLQFKCLAVRLRIIQPRHLDKVCTTMTT